MVNLRSGRIGLHPVFAGYATQNELSQLHDIGSSFVKLDMVIHIFRLTANLATVYEGPVSRATPK